MQIQRRTLVDPRNGWHVDSDFRIVIYIWPCGKLVTASGTVRELHRCVLQPFNHHGERWGRFGRTSLVNTVDMPGQEVVRYLRLLEVS